jgi:hypothetical protein
MLARMLGAIRMNVDTYEDVEGDRSATWQAMAVVVIVSICTGVGALLSGVISGEESVDILDLVFGVILGIVGWALWALVTWIVGSTILKTPETVADWGQLARGTGFAQAPGVFRIFVFVPGVGGLIGLLALIWQIACMIIAVRQCLDYTSTWRAFFVVLISLIPYAILIGISTIVLDLAGAGAS